MDSFDAAKAPLVSFALVLAAGLVGSVLAKKLRVPDIVVFLLLGLGLGSAAPDLLGIRQTSTLNQVIVTSGACFLLFEGGMTLQFRVLKEVWISLVVLATVGVLVTGALTAGFGVWLGIPGATALVLGAVTASTDPAALVPLFKQVPIRPRVAQTILAESAFNDAMAAMATFTIVQILGGTGPAGGPGGVDVLKVVGGLGWQAGAGIAFGAVFGLAGSLAIGHKSLGFFRGAEPFVFVLVVLAAYLLADWAGASGFMAVFVVGVVTGNRDTFGLGSSDLHQGPLDHSVENLSLLMRMSIFILLGSQVDFSQLVTYWWQGLVLLAGFLLVARPVTVFLCAGPDRRARWTLRELLFMAWTRETGVIPAALVGLLAGMKVPGMDTVAPITFIFILGSILVQAPSTAWVARRLGLSVS